MSLFDSKKAEYEYVHAYIEVTGFEIGDYSVDLNGFAYDEIEMVGTLFGIRSNSIGRAASGRVEVVFECPHFVSRERETLGLMDSQSVDGVFAVTPLTLTSAAQRHLVSELRWRSPKFLTFEGRREKGAQGLFEVLGFRLSQDRTGLI
jgi:hypothetical protein